MTTPEQQPMLHYWLTHPEAAHLPADRVVDLQVAFAQALRPAVEAVIGNHVQTDTPVIIEGYYLLPGPLPDLVRAVFVHEPDVEQLVHNFRLREPDAGEQRGRAEVSAGYGDWLAQQALRHGIPVVAARPWDTALDRLYELLD
jgi:2-phosphoglycerate kinase